MNSSQAIELATRFLFRGAGSVRGSLSFADLKRLCAKVLAANPPDIKAYAYRAGRNAAIDAFRREEAAVRVRKLENEKASKALQDAKVAWDNARDMETAREQFARFIACLPQSSRDLTRDQKIEIVRQVVIEGKKERNLAEAFPGSTPAQRWQWKHRGVRLLLKHNPPEPLSRILREAVQK
jgi:predicted RNA polymerase sigma factor